VISGFPLTITSVALSTRRAIFYIFASFHKLMRDWGWLSGDEPSVELICQGMVYKDGAKMSKSKAMWWILMS